MLHYLCFPKYKKNMTVVLPLHPKINCMTSPGGADKKN
jgi:hypothetical protein